MNGLTTVFVPGACSNSGYGYSETKAFLGFSSLVLCSLVRPGAYPREEHLQTLAVLGNIRLGWKSLPGTNTIAYWAHS
jgi:hypothetical protein